MIKANKPKLNTLYTIVHYVSQVKLYQKIAEDHGSEPVGIYCLPAIGTERHPTHQRNNIANLMIADGFKRCALGIIE